MGLTGWVKNLPDGRVEILVQGPKEIIDKLMAAVDHRFEGSIRKKDVEFSPLLSRFQDFEIAF
jgi:acylphosphatase